MTRLRGTQEITRRFRGTQEMTRRYRGTQKVWQLGAQYTDPLDNLSSFSVTSTGSGIGITGGEAYWNGTTDGQGIALYNQSARTNDQYVAGTIGGTITSRGSGLIFHCDSGYTGYYGVVFYSNYIGLVRTSGRWTQNSITTLGSATPSVSSGMLLEAWNIGDAFRVRLNGNIIISTTVSGSIRGESYRRQGFGMYRSSFTSSTRLADWRGGDAEVRGLTA